MESHLRYGILIWSAVAHTHINPLSWDSPGKSNKNSHNSPGILLIICRICQKLWIIKYHFSDHKEQPPNKGIYIPINLKEKHFHKEHTLSTRMYYKLPRVIKNVNIFKNLLRKCLLGTPKKLFINLMESSE